MGAESTIEWTRHTFNIVWGCVKVSPGCANCYAETWAKRHGHDVWGPAKTTSRRVLSDDYWKQPLKWDKAAAAAGERHRVFCSSMADVFEDHPTVAEQRARLWPLIATTPNLDWLLLTKRPENMRRLAPVEWAGSWPTNVWAMTTVENQEEADRRIPELLKVPARVRGLSCEPLLGPVNFHVCEDKGDAYGDGAIYWNMLSGERWMRDGFEKELEGTPPIHWVIAGGESGPKARPAHPKWYRDLRDQCQAAGVAFHFKQWGEWFSEGAKPEGLAPNSIGPERCRWLALDGSVVEIGNGEMRTDDVLVVRAGKKAAGRVLDGRTWDEVPG